MGERRYRSKRLSDGRRQFARGATETESYRTSTGNVLETRRLDARGDGGPVVALARNDPLVGQVLPSGTVAAES